MNTILFNYARSLVLFTIHSQEYHDSFENNEARMANVQESEGIMRECLKKLAVLEEHYRNLEEVERLQLKLKKDDISQKLKKS